MEKAKLEELEKNGGRTSDWLVFHVTECLLVSLLKRQKQLFSF